MPTLEPNKEASGTGKTPGGRDNLAYALVALASLCVFALVVLGITGAPMPAIVTAVSGIAAASIAALARYLTGTDSSK